MCSDRTRNAIEPEQTVTPDRHQNNRPMAPQSLDFFENFRANLIMALRFFSRLPTGRSEHEPPDLGRMAPVLPLASLIIGAGPAAVLFGGAALGLPGYFVAALAVSLGVVVTGAMAEDAIADSADGLFGGDEPARRLDIMKDSRHGTYGVAALCLLLALRITALGSLAIASPLAAGAVWLASSVVARSGALWLASALPSARANGLAAAVGPLAWRKFAIGAVVALVPGLALAAPFAGANGIAAAALLGIGVIGGWTALCKRLVGGQTGDLVGALVALTEIAVLTGLLLGIKTM